MFYINLRMEGAGEDCRNFRSEVITFMESHQDLTVRECLELFLKRQIQHEEESYDRMVREVK